MLTVADIMTRDVLVVRAWAAVDDVAAALVLHDVGGAPVRGEGGRIVGFISRADLLDTERIDAIRAALGDPSAPLSAAELMTPAFVMARAGDPAIAAARLLVEEPAHRLLIFDEQDELVGIVTPANLLRTLVPDPAPSPATAPPARAAAVPAPLPPAAPPDEPPTRH